MRTIVRICIAGFTLLLGALGRRQASGRIVEWAATKYPGWAYMRSARGWRLIDQGRGDEAFSELRSARDAARGKRARLTYQEMLCRALAFYFRFDEAEDELENLRELNPEAAAQMEEAYEVYRNHPDDPKRPAL